MASGGYDNGRDAQRVYTVDSTGTPVTPGTPAASEVHLGQVGGHTALVTPSITVDTAVYASGDVVGGKLTLANAMRVTGGTGVLQSLMILDRSNQKPAGDVFIFDSDPTNGTYTDNGAVSFGTDDLKLLGRINISASDYVTANSKAFQAKTGLGLVVKAVTGTSLYAVFVNTSAPDFVAGTDFQLRFGFLQD